MAESIAHRYLRLGLRLRRHVEGMVDAYFGPPELAAEVEAEDLVPAATLGADAEALLAETDDGWLRDQLVGLRTYAGVLAGDAWSYEDEVEQCYGVRPAFTDEAVFADAHERLEELLPGEGPLAERYEGWRSSMLVPPERIETTLAAVIEEAREATRRLVTLPDGEGVDLEMVSDVPWLAFCEYRGELRSHISVNVDLPMTAIDLLEIAIHETYAGHHTERCVKDDLLVGGRGLLEETIVLVPTPQSLVAEGIAVTAPPLLLEGEAGETLTSVVRDAGIELDLSHALAVERVSEPCRWANLNAALMLHARGAGEDEARAYAERWGLLAPDQAAHLIRFLTEPTSRSYIITYLAGRDLARAYVAGDPARFRRLLTEQVRVGDLVQAHESA